MAGSLAPRGGLAEDDSAPGFAQRPIRLTLSLWAPNPLLRRTLSW